MRLKNHLGEAVGVILVGIFFLLEGYRCPIKLLLGVSCPGCGMTRAVLAALRFDFASAFFYHPLWIFLPAFGILYLLLQRRRSERSVALLLIVGCAVMLAVYFYRLLLLPQDVVVWNPENGLLARWIEAIRQFLLPE